MHIYIHAHTTIIILATIPAVLCVVLIVKNLLYLHAIVLACNCMPTTCDMYLL